MFKTLYAKLSATFLLLFCLVTILLASVTAVTSWLYIQEVTQKLNASLAQNLLTGHILVKDGQVNEKALKEIFHTLMVINPSIEIYLLDREGNILSFSAPRGKVKGSHVSLAPIRLFLEGSSTFPIKGDDPRHPGTTKIFSVAEIPGGNAPQGYLYVVLGGEQFDSAARMVRGSYVLKLGAWAGLGALLFTLLTGLVLFNRLTRRLRHLSRAIEDFEGSDFEQAPVPGRPLSYRENGDEIDRLTQSFRHLEGRILNQMEDLTKADHLRRELVVNVSHDLRTPLAALRGYLETLLLKEESLDDEQRRNYLKIAVDHSKRLGKLISELFELARLDSNETQAVRESFSIGELVQDVVQKYDLIARQKDIQLVVNYQPDLPFVDADIGLIERVLENLIENALRFTPRGGSVTLNLHPEPQQVAVEITDTGCGISAQDLPHIFDRYYRVKTNGHRSFISGGLGLAIVKKILELHDSGIQVSSKLDEGTTFRFGLPVFQAGPRS